LEGEKADLIFTDPPYNLAPADRGVAQTPHQLFAMGAGEMTDVEFADFLTTTLGNAAAFSKDGAIAYVCMDWRHMAEVQTAGKRVFSELKNLCVWNKHVAGMGKFYRSKHELVFVFKVGTAPHINNFGMGGDGRYRTNVWDYPGLSGFGADRQSELQLHPTVKPVALVEDAIKDCSRFGNLVLDPFAGSGTTLIAAEATKRSARLIEIASHYCDVIIRRASDYHGMPVRHAAGATFDEVRASRIGSTEIRK
jgi:DNA modification methylase